MIVFELAQELYALPISQVREVLPIATLTPFVAAPAELAGMLRLRGALLPVVDLRRRLGLPHVPQQIGHCIIAVQLGSCVVGLLVDGVRDVVAGGGGLDPLHPGATGDFVDRVTQASGQVIAVLNAEETIGKAMCKFLAAIMRNDGSPVATPDNKVEAVDGADGPVAGV